MKESTKRASTCGREEKHNKIIHLSAKVDNITRYFDDFIGDVSQNRYTRNFFPLDFLNVSFVRGFSGTFPFLM